MVSVVPTRTTGTHTGTPPSTVLGLPFGITATPRALSATAFLVSVGLGAVISTGAAGCNPDFNYSVVGLITRWTPVKNLTFSADLSYIMLDQKFADGTTFAAPAVGRRRQAGRRLRDQGPGRPATAAPRSAQLVIPVDLILI